MLDHQRIIHLTKISAIDLPVTDLYKYKYRVQMSSPESETLLQQDLFARMQPSWLVELKNQGDCTISITFCCREGDITHSWQDVGMVTFTTQEYLNGERNAELEFPIKTWDRDRVALELNIAILHSFQKAKVTMVDHQTASRQFLTHDLREKKAGRECPGDWGWVLPATGGSACPVWHHQMRDFYLEPAYHHAADRWDVEDGIDIAQSAGALDGLNHAVLGIGSTVYEQFCAAGIAVNKALAKAGANCTVPLHKGDEIKGQAAATFKQWLGLIARVLGADETTGTASSSHAPKLTVTFLPATESILKRESPGLKARDLIKMYYVLG